MTGRICNNLIEVRQGDSFVINVIIQGDDDENVDLTSSVLLMQVRDNNDKLMFEVKGTDVDMVDGKMALILTPQQTGIAVGEYVTDIQLTDKNGAVNTIFPANINQTGIFRVTKQITRGA